MISRRVAKASQAIKEVVGMTILQGLRDPRVKNVTVLSAEASADMRSAKIYISVMGDVKTEALTLKGLESARGFLQSKIAERLQTRQTPILTFVIDRGIKSSIATSLALRDELRPANDATDATALDHDEEE
ncbi:MAG: 30S ribosome-binding factor RbfA [Planctomycetota bacterium]|nr:30S ribosome-binding factor RbfA [Planctomycetaceae bacterium]MDQ3333535.1 30S ribosome-binding factor RbfA [Planctomycetota bacterium]